MMVERVLRKEEEDRDGDRGCWDGQGRCVREGGFSPGEMRKRENRGGEVKKKEKKRGKGWWKRQEERGGRRVAGPVTSPKYNQEIP
ncbi:hypothetical protein MRB53_004485 [Persea americana]|uniref:Uncharacterized protein n=1 Tax=Persea americana TaxID=3435 RepID=A0ACC2MC52_PERAE|nr:hypothetical protein MRB53_004485 [Persea americana]